MIAIRGAISACNTEESIREKTLELFNRLIKVNRLKEKNLLMVQFSLTEDLDCLNPCTCLREADLCLEAALFCVQEARIMNSRASIIRVLVLARGIRKPVNVYLGDASNLRKLANQI